MFRSLSELDRELPVPDLQRILREQLVFIAEAVYDKLNHIKHEFEIKCQIQSQQQLALDLDNMIQNSKTPIHNAVDEQNCEEALHELITISKSEKFDRKMVMRQCGRMYTTISLEGGYALQNIKHLLYDQCSAVHHQIEQWLPKYEEIPFVPAPTVPKDILFLDKDVCHFEEPGNWNDFWNSTVRSKLTERFNAIQSQFIADWQPVLRRNWKFHKMAQLAQNYLSKEIEQLNNQASRVPNLKRTYESVDLCLDDMNTKISTAYNRLNNIASVVDKIVRYKSILTSFFRYTQINPVEPRHNNV